MSEPSKNRTITTNELANYVVCPEAWRIKLEHSKLGQSEISGKVTNRQIQGAKIRKEWLEEQNLSHQLKLYTKVAYCLLIILAIVVFLMEGTRIREPEFFKKIFNSSPDKSVKLNGRK